MACMKQLTIAALLLFAACASSNDKVNIAKPELELVQLVAPANVGYATGPTQIQFGLRAHNNAAEPITIRRIDIQSVGTGAYELRRDSFRFDRTIQPNESGDVTFWAHAFAYATDRSGTPWSEPVTVRAVIRFDSPAGPFQQIVTRYITEFPGEGPR
jgi:hypothetical protein